MTSKSTRQMTIQKVIGNASKTLQDDLAVEEPLEIQLAYGAGAARQQKNLSITMRTPGNDAELAAGFLLTEGIIHHKDDIIKVEHPPHWNADLRENVILAELSETVDFDLKKLERHFYTTSSCGVCGKTSIDAVKNTKFPQLIDNQPIIAPNVIHQLPEKLLNRQSVFADTGGLHAAALFDVAGNLQLVREDVGRHNAVDKLIGAALFAGLLPLNNSILQVSGRASFELVQKALMAGIPIMSAVSAPSSLAAELAAEGGMTLLGFVRNERFNIYSGMERVD